MLQSILQFTEQGQEIHECGAEDSGEEDGEEGEDDAVSYLGGGGEAVAYGDGSGGNGEDVGAVGGGDGSENVGDGVQGKGCSHADDHGDGNGGGGGVAGDFRHEAGKEAGHGHDREAGRKIEAGDEEGKFLDGAGSNDQFPQGQAAGEEGNHAPHDVAFGVFPGEHGFSFFIFQEEHEQAQEEEYIGRFHGRQVRRKEGTEEGEHGGSGKEGKAYDFAPFHGAEGGVHGAEIVSGAGK